MAKETLSLELDSGLVERVRRYSEEHGTDVADTIGALIESLPASPIQPAGGADEQEWVQSLPPLTRSLLGVGAPAREEEWHSELSPAVRRMLGAGAGPADEEDYHRYLLEKYGR